MTANLDAAFVLHRRPFSDTSLLVELFSRTNGRQPVMAKGARKLGRRSGTPLHAFSPLWVSWRGRGEVPTLVSLESRSVPVKLNGERLYCGMYINELVTLMTPRGEPMEELFDLYEHTLGALESDNDVAALLRMFEMSLLAELGYAMLLTHTPDGTPVKAELWYEYEPTMGARPVGSRTARSVQGATLLSMAELDFSDAQVNLQARDLMRRVLDHHLDHRELKSRRLFDRRSRSHSQRN